MKDVPSHMMKFMKKINKENIQEVEDESVMENYRKKPTSKQNKQKQKQLKAQKRKKGEIKPSIHKDKDERDKEMKKRVPEIRQRTHRKEVKYK
ncbi:MAG: hypothetical protein K1060chlam5_00653 [Candidatus Anoxychlamydiales bacterium]|nr:hypothetical protein [Candidatus Anoxychlamydiales bacterium]